MKVHAGVWKCNHCGRESIQIGTATGSSGTECPGGCPGWFSLVKEYPLATDFEGIKEAFGAAEPGAPSDAKEEHGQM